MKEQFLNVGESWPIYDSICVCNTLYGRESGAKWFTSFNALGQQNEIEFFKERTEGSIGLPYTNKQSADMMDFAYKAYSLGVEFFSPGVRTLGTFTGSGSVPGVFDHTMAHWWEAELPRHCAVTLKINQDVVAELPALAAPPGYGPTGSGASLAHDDINYDPIANPDVTPVLNFAMTQGVPQLGCRWRFRNVLKIQRTATLEAKIILGESVREVLASAKGPLNYMFRDQDPNAGSQKSFPARFGIRVSLIGERYVQQRGQYHV